MNEQQKFCETVWEYYRAHGRHDLPWRQPDSTGAFDPYQIVVSEIMLQQTQVGRVIPKFEQFIVQFPTVQALAAVPLSEVLIAWNGLGYNRRAKFLWQAAQMVVRDYAGQLSQEARELQKLPGIGTNTAGAIATYAYNQPIVFIETNIRTVFIHHFFADKQGVSDAEIAELVAKTLDHKHPREWCWALMDYGAHLKQTVGNVGRASKHYAKQSTFEGSLRQIRGHVIRLLKESPHTNAQLVKQISDERLSTVLHDLEKEQLIQKVGQNYQLPRE